MSRLLIYANDEPLDLYGQTPFQIVFNNLNIGEITSRGTSYTSSIKLPPTDYNLSFFQILTANSTSEKPYQIIDVRILEDGVPIFSGSGSLLNKSKFLTLSIFKDTSVFDSLKNTKVNNFRGGGTFAFTDANMFSLRNVVNSVGCPLVNWGKLNNIPLQTLENGSFTTSLEPWENTRSQESDWRYDTDHAEIDIDINIAGSTLFNPFKIWAGFKYRVNCTVTLSASIGVQVRVILAESPYTIINIMGTVSTSGSHNLSVDFKTDQNFDGFGFEAVSTGGGAQTVEIDDVTVEVDYDSFIELSYPFYLPMMNYGLVLRQSISSVPGIEGFDEDAEFTNEQNDFFDSLLLAYAGDSIRYSDDELFRHNIISEADGTQTTTVDADIQFPIVVKSSEDKDSQGYGVWSISDTVLTLQTGTGSFYVDFLITLVIDVTTLTGGAQEINIIFEEVSGPSLTVTVDSTGQHNITIDTRLLSDTGYLVSGAAKDFHVTLDGDALSFDVDILSARIEVIQVPSPQDETIVGASILTPDIPVYDFFRDYLIRTGSLVRYNEYLQEFETKPLQNIIADKHLAVDWTSKRCNTESDGLEFQVNGYAQNNFFDDDEYTEEEIGRMALTVVNENIDSEKIYYTSLMNSRSNEPVKTGNIANINVFPQESEKTFNNPSASRPYEFEGTNNAISLIKTRDSVATDPVVNYGATNATTFKVGTYATWSEFKDLFYTNLEQSLQRAKIVNHSYNLSPVDIQNLDLFKLIFDNGSYYLLLTVKYSPGKISNVELLKVQ